MFWKKKIVITHSGSFHPDEVFAVATLLLLHGGKMKIIRSRDAKDFVDANFVVDVGGEYDAKRGRFDHHQEGGAGLRPNLVPYASFGLVWKEFGEKITGDKSIADSIDKNLVQGIDTMDNGVGESKPLFADAFSYDVRTVIFSMNPTWKEGEADKRFSRAVLFAEKILARLVEVEKDENEGKKIAKEAYLATADKRIIILEQALLPWEGVLGNMPEPIFVVEPDTSGRWKAKAVRNDFRSFKNRKDFPLSWAGKSGKELADISNVPYALFCHNKRFIVVAGSKEGAIALAKKALDA